jgi:hypothetical protein
MRWSKAEIRALEAKDRNGYQRHPCEDEPWEFEAVWLRHLSGKGPQRVTRKASTRFQ